MGFGAPQTGGQGPASTAVPRIGSAVVVIDSNRVLLGRRAKTPNLGKWVLPGGKIEPYETIAAAGSREVCEETGLVVEVGETFGVQEIVNPGTEHRIILYSWARPVGGALQAGDDLSEVVYVSRDALGEYDLSDVTVQALRTAGWLPVVYEGRAAVAS